MTSPEQADVVAALQKASVAAFETGIRHILSDLDAGEEVREVELARVRDDYVDKGQTDAAHRIDELCRALGIDTTDWGSAFVGGTLERAYSGHAISRRDVRHSVLDGWSIGRYVAEKAFDILPIEQYEDGEGFVDVSLVRGDEHVLRLQAEAALYITWPDASEELLEDEEGEGSETEYYITYKASILRVEP